jgi:hypothetical protein
MQPLAHTRTDKRPGAGSHYSGEKHQRSVREGGRRRREMLEGERKIVRTDNANWTGEHAFEAGSRKRIVGGGGLGRRWGWGRE